MSQDRNLPWNRNLVQHLLGLARKEQLGHAYLLQGQQGIGKRSAVMDFAAKLFCQQADMAEACGKCRGCHLFKAGTHPDFIKLSLENDATQIKIEQVRSSQSFIANTPMLGKYKIVLIEPAESLNINAANALLKNLEEPAKGTLFFLLSHQPGILLATIHSRCQKIKIARPDKDQALVYLKQFMSEEQAEQALGISRGAPLKALSFANTDSLQQTGQVYKTLLSLFKGDTTASESAQIWEQVEGVLLIESLLSGVDFLLRHLQVHAADESPVSYSKELNELLKRLRPEHVKYLHYFYQELIRARRMLQSRANPNKLLLFESLCLQWLRLLCYKQIQRKLIA